MKKNCVKFIDNGGLLVISGFLVIDAIAIGTQIVVGIMFFALLIFVVGYYVFKTGSHFREPFIRHSIEYHRVESKGEAHLTTGISITAIGNINFDGFDMTVKELYDSLTQDKNDCYVKSYFINGRIQYCSADGDIDFSQNFSSVRINGFDLLSCLENHSELFDQPLKCVQGRLYFAKNSDLFFVSSPFVKGRRLYFLDFDNYFDAQYIISNDNINLDHVFGSDKDIIKHLFSLALLTGDDSHLKRWRYPKGFIYGTIVNGQFDICHGIKDRTCDFNLNRDPKSEERSSTSCTSRSNYKEIRDSVEEIDHKIADGCKFSIVSISKWENVYKKEILSLLDVNKSVSKENQDRIMQILALLLKDLEAKADHEQEEGANITVSALEKIAAMDGLNDGMDIFASRNTGKADS